MDRLIRSLLFTVFFICSLGVNAQLFLSLDDFSQRMRSNDKPRIIIEESRNIAGSPYAQKEFTKGMILQFGESSYIDIPMKYNIYTDRIEFRDSKGVSLYVVNPGHFKEFRIADRRYVYGNYIHGRKITSGIYELLEEGFVSLLKKERIMVQDSEPARYFNEAKPARFVVKPTDYFVVIDRRYIYNIKSMRGLIKLLGEQNKEALNDYCKKNRLKVFNEDDLRHLLRFSNSLN